MRSETPGTAQVLPRRLAGAAVLGAVVLALGGCGSADRTAPAASGTGYAADLPAVDGEPGLIHVHGLGVDPDDGTLYAATHSGLFRVPEGGEAVRVANRYQDTMGFTVTADGEFLGSGHPDLREDLPPLLGLISSTDGGTSWRPESLLGEADFHVLRAGRVGDGEVVYGYDSTSGAFRATTDRRTWQRRSDQPLRDFALDPADGEHLVGVGPEGLVTSRDGGRGWTVVPGAPAVVALAWDRTGLVGVGEDGRVHTSTDAGATWTARGTAGGPPEAVAVSAGGPGGEGAGLYVAVSDVGIVHSRDGGATFEVRYAAPSG